MFDFYSTHVSESNQWFLWNSGGYQMKKMLLISILSAQNCHPQLIDVSGVYLGKIGHEIINRTRAKDEEPRHGNLR